MEQTDVPDDLHQQWHEAQANRRMQFKVGNFKLSEIRILTGTLKADMSVLIILFASIQFCPIADHVMLTVRRSVRDLLGTLAAWSKKKRYTQSRLDPTPS